MVRQDRVVQCALLILGTRINVWKIWQISDTMFMFSVKFSVILRPDTKSK